ncbi:5-methylcytosine-specific restriction endonuclease system specificity protein McrC [Paenibacillus camelliae]|uniref:5-methylcytosine-specific restriction endonuclease system specificity protein McrC n=1 Tax=Paenibacillus camelliae TaxID=512410 RepID=UPI00203DF688|nr:5-methylcytosine-specific restriction endonuclease system specificity protein McrC [Paenibacillus camelliae]MCM3634260.1 5-methylcytosine-specific restriction endonuclease system specificity protein McrC [Paenibacillus camelliae]
MIAIHNIYYMLSYAFQVLSEQGYKSIATEQFDNTAELCTAILIKGVSNQLRRGLGKEYVPQQEALSTLRGKVDMATSIKTQSILKRQLVCEYDEFSINSYMNQVIKSTMELLLRSDVSKHRKKELRKLLLYFAEVSSIELHSVNWNIHYNRNNHSYRMLVSICYLIVKGLLQSKTDGSIKLMDFLDEQRMSRLYEKFILEFYKKEFPMLKVSASQIQWQLDYGHSTLLPIMQSDIMLSCDNKVLIIDAKYYEANTQSHYDAVKLHSSHLYQMFTYVKNKEAELSGQPHEVAGMLLYAKTNAHVQPNQEYRMSGNLISVKTLDLNCEFSEVSAQLKGIVNEYLHKPLIN